MPLIMPVARMSRVGWKSISCGFLEYLIGLMWVVGGAKRYRYERFMTITACIFAYHWLVTSIDLVEESILHDSIEII